MIHKIDFKEPKELKTDFIRMQLAIVAVLAVLIVSGCSPSAPVRHYASENAISLKYSAYDSVPTLTAEALEMAAQHCEQYGKHANYKGGNAVNAFSAQEIHNFACEKTKADDGAVIAGQSQRPSVLVVQ